jgi:catechol 2,3-dioxygenase-like lactoylglutathione lyase family enzyme
MSKASVTGVRNVDIAVVDLEGAAKFYEEICGLRIVATNERSVFLRGSGRHHHIVGLHRGARPALIRIVFDADDRKAVDALHEAVATAAAGPVERPHALTAPGSGYGFGFKDAEGRCLAVVGDVADHREDLPDGRDKPRKIAHVNLNSRDRDRSSQFLIDVLGFRLIDETDVNCFLCCGRDHHSMVIGRQGMTTLNHVAFDMPDLDSVMRGAGRLRDAGHPIEWGVGRHGPGNNVFAYFLGREEFPLEYTGEVQQIDESYQPKGPADWKWPPGRLDQWGVTDPPTARWKRTQSFIRFSDDGWLLNS